MNRDRIIYYLSIILFLVCFIELFYKLGEIPYGIHVDEAGSLYDAISISDYGVDRFLYKILFILLIMVVDRMLYILI